jgi:triacylglycerol lipase
MVFPAPSATLAGADNRHLAAVAHVAMLQHEAVFAEACRWLGEAPVDAQ